MLRYDRKPRILPLVLINRYLQLIPQRRVQIIQDPVTYRIVIVPRILEQKL